MAKGKLGWLWEVSSFPIVPPCTYPFSLLNVRTSLLPFTLMKGLLSFKLSPNQKTWPFI